jgi:hypothetical protein
MPEGEFLHDLQTDPKQLQNLVANSKYAETLKRMRTRCDSLRDQLGGEYSLENTPTMRYLKQKKQKQPK